MHLDAERVLQGLPYRASRDTAAPIALLILCDVTKQWLQCVVGLPAGSDLLPDFAIKMDKSLILSLPDSGAGDTLVKSILGFGGGLGIAITAEGVETEARLAFLRREGCAQAQGFLFSHTVPITDIPALLARSAYSRVAA